MSVFDIWFLFVSYKNHSHYQHNLFDVHLATLLRLDIYVNRTLTTIEATHDIPAELLNFM